MERQGITNAMRNFSGRLNAPSLNLDPISMVLVYDLAVKSQ
jgi:hypothetical protein